MKTRHFKTYHREAADAKRHVTITHKRLPPVVTAVDAAVRRATLLHPL